MIANKKNYKDFLSFKLIVSALSIVLFLLFSQQVWAGPESINQIKPDSQLSGQSGLRLSTFDIDVTPPVGSQLAYDTEINKWDLGLRAKGIILLGAGKPILVCAVDWLAIGNEGMDAFKDALAAAGGTAETLYNKGIEMSMNSWGITDAAAINAYINGNSLPPIAPAPENGWATPPLSDIPVKFSADVAKQREQIGTQKWLAIYPNGMEAWAEMRRSGYPKMYPLINSDNPDMPKDKMIRRIVFMDLDRQTNGKAVTAAEALLGTCGDKVSTRLWWDVKP